MPSNDGTIQLGVSLSAKDVKQVANELRNAVEEIFDRSSGNVLSTELENIKSQMVKATQKAGELASKIEALETKKFNSNRAAEVAAELEEVQRAYDERAASLTGYDYDEQLELLGQRMMELIAESERLQNTPAFTDKDAAYLEHYNNELNNTNNQLSLLIAKFEEAGSTQRKVSVNSAHAFEGIAKGADKGIKSMKRLVMGILGVRGAFSVIRKATSSYLSMNEQLSKRMNAIWASLGQLLGPLIEWLIGLISKLFGYFNSFIKALTGIDLAAKASAKSLKKQAGAMKGLNRQQAKFDEMNTLNNNSGGGGGGSAGDFNFPKFDVEIDNIGKDLAQKLNEWLANIDWAGLAQKISDGIIWLFDQIGDFITNFSLISLVRDIITFFANVDWGGILSSIMYAIGALVSKLAMLLPNLLVPIIEAVFSWFSKKIEEAKEAGYTSLFDIGMYIIEGLLEGIWNIIKGIGVWIYDHILKPFVEGFCNAFEIGSPSKVFERLGGFIIEGLKNGLLGVWNAVKAVFSPLISWFQTNVITPLVNAFSNAWTTLKTGASKAWEGIKSVFSKVGTFFRDTFSSAWKKVKDVFSIGGQIFADIKDGILTAFKKVVNGLIKGINSVVAVPFNGINRALSFIRNIDILGLKPFKNLGSISVPSIPYLAQGAVIPPNKEFLAILGDQKQGTNIEAPLDTIVDAFKKVQGESSQPITIELKVDGKTLARTVVEAQKKLGLSFNG